VAQFHWDPSTYEELMRAEVPRYDELQEAIAAASAGRAVGRILDLGSGTGATAQRALAAHPSATLVGVDESEEMLSVAKHAIPHADLRVARLQDPLPEGPFDLVVSALAVHHLDAGEKATLFRRVRAELAPEGRFVLGDVVVPEDPADATIPLEDGYDLTDSEEDQLRWLGDAGFDAAVAWSAEDLAVLIADPCA
jgi:tRNA (cmo5U34)-methyltransferase